MSSLVLIGAGGHARVLIAALKRAGRVPIACVDSAADKWNQAVLGVRVIGDESKLTVLAQSSPIELVNGIGVTGASSRRRDVWSRLHAAYRFATVRDPSATIVDDSEIRLGEGVQLLAGAIVQVGVEIGDNTIVNTGAQIDHDCKVGSHCHIAPGAVLCGDVRVGDSVFVGAGAVIKQGISVGAGATIAMGAVVIRDVEGGATVGGNPAERLHAR